MRLVGGAIGPDEVMVWTSDRELVRLARDGTRTLVRVPVPALGAHLGPDGIVLVDGLGTVHRYTHAGQHTGAQALVSPIEGHITAATVAATGRMAAIIENPRYEDSGEAEVFEAGVRIDWGSRGGDGYREEDVTLTPDGEHLLIEFARFYYFTGYGSAGDNGNGARVVRRDGTIVTEGYDRLDDFIGAAMSPSGMLVTTERFGSSVHLEMGTADFWWWWTSGAQPPAISFGDAHVAALYGSELLVADPITRQRATLDLPEQFREAVFCERDIVLVHDELGPWWVPIASLRFEGED